MNIISINQKALDIYLEHRTKNPDFTFATRVKNNQDRLVKGHWFQGSDYVFTSPYRAGDANTKTKTIGFVITKSGCYIEINFCDSRNQKKIDFYKEALGLLEIDYISGKCRYSKQYDQDNWEKELFKFLKNIVPEIDKLIKKYQIEKDFFIAQEVFKRNLMKIDKAREKQLVIEKQNSVNLIENEPLNKILYGPPGTGKTFSTIRHAMKVLDPNADPDDDPESIKDIKEAYPNQVEFVTFHQSFSYEDFVEGLRANEKGGNINYSVEDGVFKNLCVNAVYDCQDFSSAKTKQTTGFTEVYDQFIAIVSENLPYKVKTSSEKTITITGISSRDTLKTSHEGSEVNHSVGRQRIKKLFEVFNTREKLDKVKNVQNEFREIIGGLNSTVYWAILNKLILLKDELEASEQDGSFNDRVLDVHQKKKILSDVETLSYEGGKPHVLIIDEINRGNISRIFGELITLIEPSKRSGRDEEITVTLPYSKESFSVPGNLFIIGTMNTADRSLAMMDTALRRRFDFIEMMPNPQLFKEEGNVSSIDDVDLVKLLTTINQRIEALYDREHTIGHAFFMSLKSGSTIKDLAKIFENKVLPLLEEYFYDDWEKIRLVLADQAKPKSSNLQFYIEETNLNHEQLFPNSSQENRPIENKSYRRNVSRNPGAYIRIYEPIETNDDSASG